MRERETFRPANLGKGAWPDGIAFDQYGNLWGTMVYSGTNSSLLRPREMCECCLMRGMDAAKVDAAEEAFFRNHLGRRAVCYRAGYQLRGWRASLSVGRNCGRSTSVAEREVHTVLPQSPVAGLPIVHWSDR